MRKNTKNSFDVRTDSFDRVILVIDRHEYVFNASQAWDLGAALKNVAHASTRMSEAGSQTQKAMSKKWN